MWSKRPTTPIPVWHGCINWKRKTTERKRAAASELHTGKYIHMAHELNCCSWNLNDLRRKIPKQKPEMTREYCIMKLQPLRRHGERSEAAFPLWLTERGKISKKKKGTERGREGGDLSSSAYQMFFSNGNKRTFIIDPDEVIPSANCGVNSVH